MTGSCDNCHHFSDDLVLVSEGEPICKECMLQFAAAYEPANPTDDPNELWLLFDDDGEELLIGDQVLVNDEVETTIEGEGGKRWLKGFPPSDEVHSVQRITPPLENSWPEDLC